MRLAQLQLPRSHPKSLLKTGIIFSHLEFSDSKHLSERLNTAAHNSAFSSLNSLGWALGLNTRKLWQFLRTHSISAYHTLPFPLTWEQIISWVLLFCIQVNLDVLQTYLWPQVPVSILQSHKLIWILKSKHTFQLGPRGPRPVLTDLNFAGSSSAL